MSTTKKCLSFLSGSAPNRCDPKTQFDCGGGMCVNQSVVCDKKPDCPAWEDEPKALCNINECAIKNGGCSHICVDMPAGYYCDCPHGYQLNGNSTCEGKHIYLSFLASQN